MALHTRVPLRTRLLLAALLPGLATAMMVIPPLRSTWLSPMPCANCSKRQISPLPIFSRSGPDRSIFLFWLLVFVVSAPMVAFVVNWHWPAATNTNRAFLVALPQPVIVPLMLRFDVWLDLRGGYLLRDSGEEAMAYGIATVGGLLIGLILMILVAVGGQLGARLGDR
ncbi:MAG TPA: hypothetical protein VGR29_12050 [Thermomicrobiales bacterium]|nr:hypothetical protein [Thermomicrobiales bacterium]